MIFVLMEREKTKVLAMWLIDCGTTMIEKKYYKSC